MVDPRPIAVVDIGSNSVRLVVYSGATRVPSVVFNEKVMAGLGRGMNGANALAEEAQERALAGLSRFALLIRQMGVERHRTVATAAVRDASNGEAFLDRVRKLGFKPEILSGRREAAMAGFGVISGIPDADGIVGDLGGGSLELVDISGGEVRRTASLPLGVLRLDPLVESGALPALVKDSVRRCGFEGLGKGRPFYMVGGSWRNLARFDILLTGYPLAITHQYELEPSRPAELRKVLANPDAIDPADLTLVSASRVATLPAANHLLEALVRAFDSGKLVVSSYGIREGILYDGLDKSLRSRDPLVDAAREVGIGLGRFSR